ncbi:MAG: dihydrofolate reductase family protein [Mangrovicoccus sp.]
MTQTNFSLLVVTSADGFIARRSGHAPHDWASKEEQTIFLKAVDAADWGIMGRGTHSAADKPHRRRVLFSRQAPVPEWRRPTQIWCDPSLLRPQDLVSLTAPVHPMRQALILGGTQVHDWFLQHQAIDEIVLTIEPVTFGNGLPVFSGQPRATPEEILAWAGFTQTDSRRLNAGGTRLLSFRSNGQIGCSQPSALTRMALG